MGFLFVRVNSNVKLLALSKSTINGIELRMSLKVIFKVKFFAFQIHYKNGVPIRKNDLCLGMTLGDWNCFPKKYCSKVILVFPYLSIFIERYGKRWLNNYFLSIMLKSVMKLKSKYFIKIYTFCPITNYELQNKMQSNICV